MSDETTVSRRSFLKRASAALAAGGVGAVAGGVGLSLATGEQRAEAEVEWPLPYTSLDPDVVRVRGHANYYKGECCYGAFSAILETLREEVGGPYNEIPSEMMYFGGGGIAGWGTTCGALIGSCSAMSLVAADKEVAKALANELLGWYSTTALPTDVANQFAIDAQYTAEMKAAGALEQSTAGSPLCHVSVSNWCEASGFASKSPERAERCARLVGDTAAKAVELLNAQFANGALEPGFTFSDEALGCMSCHFLGENFEAGQFTQGKGECTSCHGTMEEAHSPSS